MNHSFAASRSSLEGSSRSAREVALRPGRAADAPDAGRIVFEAFNTIARQHRFPPDFASPEAAAGLVANLLARPEIHSVVAERDGRLLGSNFLWERDAIAGVGPITVDPRVQNDRIGRSLMQSVLARAEEQGFKGVRLVQAAYHGRSLALYSKLGFEVREPLCVVNGAVPGHRIAGRVVRPATMTDVEPCRVLGERILGESRVNEFRQAVELRQAMVVVEEAPEGLEGREGPQGREGWVGREGRITGYTTGIGFFGHSAAETNTDLQALIAAAPGISGPGLLVPMRNAPLLRWCLENGLRIVQPMTLMSIGKYDEPCGTFCPSVLF